MGPMHFTILFSKLSIKEEKHLGMQGIVPWRFWGGPYPTPYTSSATRFQTLSIDLAKIGSSDPSYSLPFLMAISTDYPFL